ncbi:N-acetylglucosamine kinase [Actinoplanes solisilvae]|uniref:N-acetylglucosamine kinase n=1 Tax=Actinoplanes solisilvae TaxID=2486853 RepID=UPI000FDC8A0B|nr:BadF/BadG/BcrA/BcrD ATPase family protein [Actinoplanes solisilvae]
MNLVIGVDAGGTATRAVVATVNGEVLGRGSAGPGNPLTVGAPAAAAAMGHAVRTALGALPPSLVVRGVIGLAGVSGLPSGHSPYDIEWKALGLTGPLVVVGDAVTAFAAGSPAPSGVVLIAGTGAVAAHVTGSLVVRAVDGNGWLLGDCGSGRWIGLAALRVAARDWSTPFAATVAAELDIPSADALIAWAQRLPFAEIDALAPLVCTLAAAGDPAARSITVGAAAELIRSLDDLAVEGPVVLSGSLLTSETPVREGVLSTLRERGVPHSTSRDPAAGAAWLAALPHTPLPPADLHATLLPSPG